MKRKDGFVLREIADQWILFPLNAEVVDFNNVIVLSESGAFLWNKLNENMEIETLFQEMDTRYEVGEEELRKDLNDFINLMKKNNMLID